MICSRYNYIYESKRHRKFFVYNSRTNSFMAIPFTLYEEMRRIKKLSYKEQEVEIEHMDSDLKHAFIRAKVFVNMFDDDSFIQHKNLELLYCLHLHAILHVHIAMNITFPLYL